MLHKVQEILLVSSPYDAFILGEEGQLSEQIYTQYSKLHLSSAPRVTWTSTAAKALSLIEERRFDLVITMQQLEDMTPYKLSRKIRDTYPALPVVLLTYNTGEVEKIVRFAKESHIHRVFTWSGNSEIFLAIIKNIEDCMNVEHDTREGMVRVIVVIEDSPQYYSSFLQMMYTLIMEQTHKLMDQGLNDMHKMLRMRTRPKILLADNFEDGLSLYNEFKENVIGVATDVKYPCGDKIDPEAGFHLLEKIKSDIPSVPVLMLSNNPENKDRARGSGAYFLDKNSIHLLSDLKEFMKLHFGFGDFTFHLPDGSVIGSAKDMKSMESMLEKVPAESIEYHARHHHFSTWLMARCEFRLAARLKGLSVEDFDSIEDVRKFQIRVFRQYREVTQRGIITEVTPDYFDPESDFAKIGGGSIGGKGRGITFIGYLLRESHLHSKYKGVRILVPRSLIIGTEIFDRFIDGNKLSDSALNSSSDTRLESEFLRAALPADLVDILRMFLAEVSHPLAVRSSSLLEDSHFQPFAGIYRTCMIPNNNPDIDVRLEQLSKAIKLVYASTYSQQAKGYTQSTGNRIEEEKMGIIIQGVVGRRYKDCFYPDFAGVAQSYNFFPVSYMKPDEGIAHVALGLGKSVVDLGVALHFSPAHPAILPQCNKASDALRNTQKEFYALNLAAIHEDNLVEGKVLVRLPLTEAERHGTLEAVASTYSAEDDMIVDGLFTKGPRLVTFAQILKHRRFPLPELLTDLLELGGNGMGCPVEIEFAVNLGKRKEDPSDFYFLQIRPMLAGFEFADVKVGEVPRERMIVSSMKAHGNGRVNHIRDIVYISPDRYDKFSTKEIAVEIGHLNKELNRPYLLIGPGRWGTTDPVLGIPVVWQQISNVGAIVEAGVRDSNVAISMGTHFFHNITSLRISYLTVDDESRKSFVDWGWLERQKAVSELKFVNHVRLDEPIEIRLDGRKSRGIVLKPNSESAE